ncbi:MAG: cytochrome c oxidase accessory protein CcoG [Lysobacterales bacterium CG02_land_8_20_14_3_00_62_12]|nr:MAG: cytochrome c oxidase accessory protein CcoG [Xanthomonadales bacterium CG02_land_8_20_14_3_00_62_12]
MNKTIPLQVVASDALYASEAKIYPRETSGIFQRLRTAAVFWLLGMFYLFPWLNWQGRQLVLFDLPARKFYVLGWVFWPQDFFYLSMLLMMAAFSLFFFTALAGRLWCGYACPQTVWTEVFLWMERWTCGNRHQQMKLDAAPWSSEKVLRKGAKQLLWVTFAVWTGFTFVGFFTPIRELSTAVMTATLSGWQLFWIGFYGLATYGNAGYLREQVCKYMCPYARFQGAMFDRQTLIIAYDEKRGEARGARGRGVPSVLTRDALPNAPVVDAAVPRLSAPEPALGDCIDCTICVQVCPTGIDIRDGLQYECIACGACIDACDNVMDKLGYPRGLIRYDTLAGLEGKPVSVLRPRVLIYAVILLVLVGAFLWSVAERVPLIVDVLRDRNALYRNAADGGIENAYTLKLMNQDQRTHHYRIQIESALPITLAAGADRVTVAAEQVVELPLTLKVAAGQAKGVNGIRIRVQSEDDAAVFYVQETRFFGPF